MHQVAVRAVQLQHLEAGAQRALGGEAEVALERAMSACVISRGISQPGSTAMALGAITLQGCSPRAASLVVHRPVALPGPLHARLAARVRELDAGRRAVLFEKRGDARQRLHLAVVPQAQVAVR